MVANMLLPFDRKDKCRELIGKICDKHNEGLFANYALSLSLSLSWCPYIEISFEETRVSLFVEVDANVDGFINIQ